MNQSIEATGKTIDEAIKSALQSLNTDRDSVTVEVLEKPKSGFLGLGGSPARIRVTLLAEDIPAAKPTAHSAPAKPPERPQPAAATLTQSKPTPQPAAPSTPKPAPQHPSPKPASANINPKPAKPYNPRPRPPRVDTPQEPVGEERVAFAVSYLTKTLTMMDIPDVTVKASQEERYLLLDVSGPNMGRLIGRRGETLDSVQRLTSHAVNHNADRNIRVVVDTEGYRQKREDSLITLAQKTAERAVRQQRNIPLEPMNSYARHVIHSALQEYSGVTTHSVGSEPNRRVVIAVPGGDRRPPRFPRSES